MKIKQFEVAGLAQYSYVISSEGEAVVIDPMRDFDRYTEHVAEQSRRSFRNRLTPNVSP